MEVMLIWVIGVGVLGAAVSLTVAVHTLRHGHLSQTWWTARRIERERREAMRPIPTAAERARRFRLRLPALRTRGAATPTPNITATPAQTAAAPVVTSAAERDLVSAADRQSVAAEQVVESVSALGSAQRGDEVAARRRAAQRRIAAEAANQMALTVPGRIDDFLADDPDDLALPAVSGDR